MKSSIADYFRHCRLDDESNIYLFGSRIWGAPRPFSDVDIAIDAKTMRDFCEIEERLLNSDCPFNMDVINLNTLNNPQLRERILRDGYKV